MGSSVLREVRGRLMLWLGLSLSLVLTSAPGTFKLFTPPNSKYDLLTLPFFRSIGR